MKIAVAQINTHAGDFAATAARMADISNTAAQQEVDLLVFPLCALTGPALPDYASRDGYRADLVATLQDLATKVACTCLVPVALDVAGGGYREAVLLQGGEAIPLCTRAGGRSGRPQKDDPLGLAVSDAGLVTFMHDGARVGLSFTYEELEDFAYAKQKPQVMVHFCDYAYALDDTNSALGASLGEADSTFAELATAYDCWLVAAGSLGGYDLQTFTGSSFVLTPWGVQHACAPAFEEALLVCDVDPQQSDSASQAGTGAFGDVPGAVAPTHYEVYNRSLHLWEALVLGLRDYVTKQGRSDVALLLDGSLASSLLAVLGSDALGPTHVHGMFGLPLMPEQEATARAVADSLRLKQAAPRIIMVADTKESLQQDILQACLSHCAQQNDAIVLSAADKTFLSLEVATSCRAAELLPFGDVYRSDLLELAHTRNTISPIIPRQAFSEVAVPDIEGLAQAEPTPELRLRRVDTTLSLRVEWERSISEVVARQGNSDLTTAILASFYAHDVARGSWPPALAMSTHALTMVGRPIGLGWSDRARSMEELLPGRSFAGRVDGLASIAHAVDQAEGDGHISGDDLSRMLEGLNLELLPGKIPEGMDADALESALGDLSDMLQSLIEEGGQGGGETSQGNGPFGPFGPLTWGGPFSEN